VSSFIYQVPGVGTQLRGILVPYVNEGQSSHEDSIPYLHCCSLGHQSIQ
jgi:hypothetical protein